ncbi:hypothetical protein CYMTET_33807, partial [Cymbomonas tetramitiformis]
MIRHAFSMARELLSADAIHALSVEAEERVGGLREWIRLAGQEIKVLDALEAEIGSAALKVEGLLDTGSPGKRTHSKPGSPAKSRTVLHPPSRATASVTHERLSAETSSAAGGVGGHHSGYSAALTASLGLVAPSASTGERSSHHVGRDAAEGAPMMGTSKGGTESPERDGGHEAGGRGQWQPLAPTAAGSPAVAGWKALMDGGSSRRPGYVLKPHAVGPQRWDVWMAGLLFGLHSSHLGGAYDWPFGGLHSSHLGGAYDW